MAYKCNATCRDCGDVQFTEWSFSRIVRCSLCGGILDQGGTLAKRRDPRKQKFTEIIKDRKRTTVRYDAYIRSKRWRKKRQKALTHAGHKCQECGTTAGVLQVHHLTYIRLGREKLKDLKVLCCDCHRIAHEIPCSLDLQVKAISGQ